LGPGAASDVGALDQNAIDRVRDEAWPSPESADELHEALVLLGYMTEAEGTRANALAHFDDLRRGRRAVLIRLPNGAMVWVAVDRWADFRAAYPRACVVDAPEPESGPAPEPEHAMVELLRGRLEVIGPTTSRALAESAGISLEAADGALAALEAEGFVLRGRFTPRSDGVEWCERRLLARIHRYTLGRLRSEIEPVAQVDYMRFLLSWQRAVPATRMRGPASVMSVLSQLEGFEAPAGAWESEILPLRVDDYEPSWLDAQCLSGRLVWLRLSPPSTELRPVPGPMRTTPIALVLRAHLDAWRPDARNVDPLTSSHAAAVFDELVSRGASFFDDIVVSTRLLRTHVEAALGELVSLGLVTSDSFAGLRALLLPSKQRAAGLFPPVRRATAPLGMEAAGRWSLLAAKSSSSRSDARLDARLDSTEIVARVLLTRYGVVFRRIVERETAAPSWGELLRAYRRLEARGDVRGGRFVEGFSGEQYALPDAVEALRAVRRSPKSGELTSISAADPLSLAGIATAGERVPSISPNRVVYLDGVPVAKKVGGVVDLLAGGAVAAASAGAGNGDVRDRQELERALAALV
jgi:ATP-dependent Lhr-like helicase